MGKPQMITTDGGERLVVLTERDYLALRARADDEEAEDAMTVILVEEAQERLARGEEIMLPGDVALAIAGGTPPLQAIRKWRGLTQTDLARKSGIGQAMVSQIENGTRAGTAATLRALAATLEVPLSALITD